MGIERHLFTIYLAESKTLNKRWVVKAKNIEDATGKVVSFCKALLNKLEKKSQNGDVDIDLSFKELNQEVTEV